MRYLVFEVNADCDEDISPNNSWYVYTCEEPLAKFRELKDCDDFIKEKKNLFVLDIHSEKIIRGLGMIVEK